MPTKTDAQKRAQKAYMQSRATIQLVMSAERKSEIKAAAAAVGESVNVYINGAIDARMKKEGG